MPHLFFHSAIASRSCCRTAQSLRSCIGLYTMQASANKRILEMILSGRSFMNSRNSKGPSTEPCGTPLTTSTLSEKHTSTVTLLGSVKKERSDPLVDVPSDAIVV